MGYWYWQILVIQNRLLKYRINYASLSITTINKLYNCFNFLFRGLLQPFDWSGVCTIVIHRCTWYRLLIIQLLFVLEVHGFFFQNCYCYLHTSSSPGGWPACPGGFVWPRSAAALHCRTAHDRCPLQPVLLRAGGGVCVCVCVCVHVCARERGGEGG